MDSGQIQTWLVIIGIIVAVVVYEKWPKSAKKSYEQGVQAGELKAQEEIARRQIKDMIEENENETFGSDRSLENRAKWYEAVLRAVVQCGQDFPGKTLDEMPEGKFKGQIALQRAFLEGELKDMTNENRDSKVQEFIVKYNRA